VIFRDAKSYCAILRDNSNRKTVARLRELDRLIPA